MCRAGYRYAIIEDVFMFHPGYKTTKEKKIVNGVKNVIKKKARKAIDDFNRRMDETYPETKKTCPKYGWF